jgi:nicotinic acid mononucleotide adenylyltransferase
MDKIDSYKSDQVNCISQIMKPVYSTNEELHRPKRKINANDIIIVIEKIIEKWKPMQILDYFIEQNKNNITIDMIKNIKRNLQNGKSVIYESELSKERFEYYLHLLKQFTEINSISY